MYNTTKELHIGLDLALQQLNSNRKQVVKPEEKDWFLNDTMLQVMNNHIDPNPIVPGRDSDSDQRAVDYLQSLKCDVKYKLPVTINRETGLYSIPLPADYYRKSRISTGVCLDRRKVVNGCASIPNNRTYQAIVPFVPRAAVNLSEYIENLNIVVANKVVFNAAAKRLNDTSASKYSFVNIRTHEAVTMMMVPSILESVNDHNWISAYWENYNGVNYPQSFVFIVDVEAYLYKYGSSIIQQAVAVLTAGSHILSVNLAYEVMDIMSGKHTKIVPVRIIESAKFDNVNNNSFFDSSYHSVAGVIEQGKVKVAPSNDFEIVSIQMTYYRKPKLINHLTGQNCEIGADDFKAQLVSQTAQKINAFLNGENYNQMTKENLMML